VTKLVEPRGLDAWRAFVQTHAAVILRIERDLESRGLIPLVWYDVLVAISSAPGRRLRMRALADSLVLTRSGATRLVDKLEQAGLVRREIAPEDGRGAVATLTEQGLVALRRAWPVYARGINGLFLSRLSAREIETIGRALGRVHRAALEPSDSS